MRGYENSGGFTLIEVLVVTTVLSVLASIAMPNFVRGKATAHEGAVTGTLRTIAQAQFQFRALELVDVNQDGGSEYSTMKEMTGEHVLRGTQEKLAPTLLSVSLSDLDAQGRLLRHGYRFALFLPDASGNGLAETSANLSAIDPGNAHTYWTCVAWPIDKITGRSSYFVNQQGEIMKTATLAYSGETGPPPGAALVSSQPLRIDLDQLAVNTTGADGNRWVSVH